MITDELRVKVPLLKIFAILPDLLEIIMKVFDQRLISVN